MKFLLKYIRKSKLLLIIFYAMLNLRNILRRRFYQTNLKTGHRIENSDNIINYILLTSSFFDIAEIDYKSIKTALEIGPGDNLGLSISFLDKGIQEIDVFDKFQNDFNQNSINTIYKELIESLGSNESIESYLEKISRLIKDNSKKFFLPKVNKKYDLIFSVSVLEHLWPADKIIQELSNNLTYSGIHAHVINFTDHGMFSTEHNRFYFRFIPSWIYNPIMKSAGRPNRILPDEFVEIFKKIGFESQIYPLKTHDNLLNFDKNICESITDKELKEIKELYEPQFIENHDNLKNIATGSALIISKRI